MFKFLKSNCIKYKSMNAVGFFLKIRFSLFFFFAKTDPGHSEEKKTTFTHNRNKVGVGVY